MGEKKLKAIYLVGNVGVWPTTSELRSIRTRKGAKIVVLKGPVSALQRWARSRTRARSHSKGRDRTRRLRDE